MAKTEAFERLQFLGKHGVDMEDQSFCMSVLSLPMCRGREDDEGIAGKRKGMVGEFVPTTKAWGDTLQNRSRYLGRATRETGLTALSRRW